MADGRQTDGPTLQWREDDKLNGKGGYNELYPVGNIFNDVRPWAKTRHWTTFHKNISKIAVCRLNRDKQGERTDRQTSGSDSEAMNTIQNGSISSRSGRCVRSHKLKMPLYDKSCTGNKHLFIISFWIWRVFSFTLTHQSIA